mmetsp:Transcript_21622/g.51091  ORF Transcript_21622/g.51091 Transcript_21622/m.51091 type:complete len:416 (+) Transcript_21622:112-1359(+)
MIHGLMVSSSIVLPFMLLLSLTASSSLRSRSTSIAATAVIVLSTTRHRLRHVHHHNTMNRSSIERLYRPHRKHPALFFDDDVDDQFKFLPQWIHPDLLEIVEYFQQKYQPSTTATAATCTPLEEDEEQQLQQQQQQQDQDQEDNEKLKLPQPLKKEMDGVYSFRAFSDEFVNLFNEEIGNFYQMSKQHQIPIKRPNSMNNYGVVVNEIGLRPLISAFQHDYLWPLSRILFPKQASQFDDHHSFIVRYQAGEDLGLDMHTDDSDVTFNVCLGEHGFTKSTLTFCGMFGSPDHRHVSHVYHHEIGRAILHLGNRRHGADDIATGKRINLIIWSHNWKWRSSPEYRQVRTTKSYQKESGPPDEQCLSYTHDVDYSAYEEIPERAKDLDLTPWCPPMGFEYDGFEEKIQASRRKEGNQK